MIEKLPTEIVYIILTFADYSRLSQLRLCCRSINDIVIAYLTQHATFRTIEDVVARVMYGPYFAAPLHHPAILRILSSKLLHGLTESTVHKVQVTTMTIKYLNIAAGVLNGNMHFLAEDQSHILFSIHDKCLMDRIVGSLHFVVKHLRTKQVPDNQIAHLVSGMYTSASASSLNNAFLSVLQSCSAMQLNFNDTINVLSSDMSGDANTVITPQCLDIIVTKMSLNPKTKIHGLPARAMVHLLTARSGLLPYFGVELMSTFSVYDFAKSGFSLNTYNCCSGYNKTVMLILLVPVGLPTPTYAKIKSTFTACKANNIVDSNCCQNRAVVVENIFTVTCTLIYNVGHYLLNLQ